MTKILPLEKNQSKTDFYLVRRRIYLNPMMTTIFGVTKLAKGPVVRKFMLITNARQKYVNIGTFWAIKTGNLPKKYTKRGGIY